MADCPKLHPQRIHISVEYMKCSPYGEKWPSEVLFGMVCVPRQSRVKVVVVNNGRLCLEPANQKAKKLVRMTRKRSLLPRETGMAKNKGGERS